MIKSISRFITLAALFLIPIFPLIVANSYFFPFITGKGFYFRILVEIAFLAWVVLAFADAKYRPKVNAMTLGVTIFAVIALIADLAGVNPIRSLWSNFERMEGWITIFHLWMFYIVATSVFGFKSIESGNTAEAMRWWHWWMKAFLFVGFIVACYGFGQLFGWFAIHQGSVRIDASLGNAAYMAVYMLINVGFALYLFFDVRVRKGSNSTMLQWLYAVLAAIFTVILFETVTRGTILGLLGGAMLTLFLYSILAKNNSKKSRMISGGIVALIVVAILGVYLLKNTSFVKNNDILSRMTSISVSDSESVARLQIWGMALQGAKDRPILGWGQENFNYVFNYYYNPHMWAQEQWFDRAHSVFLDWLINAGIVGLVSYLSLYVLALWAVWKSTLKITEKCVLTGLVAAYAVHNIFVFDNLASYVGFFAILGFAGSALNGEARPHKKRSEASVLVVGGNRVFSSEVVEYVVAPVSIIILIFSIYFYNIRLIQANTRLIAALQACASATPDAALFEKVFAMNTYAANQETREQIVSCASGVVSSQQAPNPVKQAMFVEAQKAVNDQIASAPKDARMYVIGGQFLSNVNDFGDAVPILEKAHILTPAKQVVDFELANDYINTGNVAKGVAFLKSAYDEDNAYPQARSGYAYGLILVGQEALSRQIFGNDPTIFNTEQAAQIYASPAVKAYSKSLAIYQTLLAASPTDVNLKTHMAQVQYQAGMVTAAITTLRSIEKDHPEYKTQIEAAITSLNK